MLLQSKNWTDSKNITLVWSRCCCKHSHVFFCAKNTMGKLKIKKNRIWLATLSLTMRSVKLSRNVSYSSRCMLEQGRSVPSKLSRAASRECHWQAWLQQLSHYAATSRSQVGNVLLLLKRGCKYILHKKAITMHASLPYYSQNTFPKSKHWQKLKNISP